MSDSYTNKKKLIIAISILSLLIITIISLLVFYRKRPIKKYVKYNANEIEKIEIYSSFKNTTFLVIDTKTFYNDLSNITVTPLSLRYINTRRAIPYFEIYIYVKGKFLEINNNSCNGHRINRCTQIFDLARSYVLTNYNVDIYEHGDNPN